MKNIRVLINGPLPPPVGGMATYCQDYLNTELPSFFDITFCRSVVLTRVHTAEGITRFVLRACNSILIVVVWLWMLLVKRPHVAHIHTNSWAGFYVKAAMSLLAKIGRAKTVMHVHGGRFEQFYKAMPPWRKRLTTRLLNANHRTIVLSQQWRKFFESIGVEPGRITIMPNSVFIPGNIHRQTDRSIPVILFMSVFERGKGILELMDAIEQRPDLCARCRLILAGPRTGLWNEIARRVGNLSVADAIEMPGALTGKSKEDAYRRADIYLLPSWDEGMPIGLLEAMSYGLACITTPVGGIPDVIKDMQNGLLVEPGDVDALASAIDLLIGDSSLRKQIGNEARRTIEQGYDWTTRAEDIRHMYHQLLGITGD